MTHQFRENGTHYNGGREWFAYGYTAIGEPRLSMIRRWYRIGKRRGQTEDRFRVDGEPADSYEAAVAKLRLPPVYTEAEIAALAQIGDEPADYRRAVPWDELHSLAAKGAIEWGPPGRCCRTDAGRAALQLDATLSDVAPQAHTPMATPGAHKGDQP